MNHTPTPFKVRFNGIVAPAMLFHQTPQGEQRIAEIYQGGDEGVANAAFIVRACNAHEALVKAATDLLAYLPLSSDGFQVQLEDALIEALQFAGADIKVTTGE